MAEVKVTLDPASTPEEPIFNFEIPGGEKGDPGGLTVSFFEGDVNTLITPGGYSCGNAVGSNLPGTQGGFLLVGWSGNNSVIIQTFISNLGPIYVRRRFNTSWSSWRVYTSSRTDQTAGRAIYQWDELNNREQLIYGDTGIRNIAALATANIAAARLYLTRDGRTVTLQIGSLTGTSVGATIDIIADGGLPAGFRPSTFENYAVAGTPVNSKIVVHASGKVALSPTPAGPLNLDLTCQWRTNEAWPTTLPGTAIGTIPNL